MAWVAYQDPDTFNLWYFNPTTAEARWHWPPLFELPFHVHGIHRMDSEVAAAVRMAPAEVVAAPERARMAPEVVAAPSKEAYAAAATPEQIVVETLPSRAASSNHIVAVATPQDRSADEALVGVVHTKFPRSTWDFRKDCSMMWTIV